MPQDERDRISLSLRRSDVPTCLSKRCADHLQVFYAGSEAVEAKGDGGSARDSVVVRPPQAEPAAENTFENPFFASQLQGPRAW